MSHICSALPHRHLHFLFTSTYVLNSVARARYIWRVLVGRSAELGERSNVLSRQKEHGCSTRPAEQSTFAERCEQMFGSDPSGLAGAGVRERPLGSPFWDSVKGVGQASLRRDTRETSTRRYRGSKAATRRGDSSLHLSLSLSCGVVVCSEAYPSEKSEIKANVCVLTALTKGI